MFTANPGQRSEELFGDERLRQIPTPRANKIKRQGESPVFLFYMVGIGIEQVGSETLAECPRMCPQAGWGKLFFYSFHDTLS
jgi:hypothetical protein